MPEMEKDGIQRKVNRRLKDSVFTALFGEIKYLRQLYAVLVDDQKEYRDEDFKILTLENVLAPDVYNDLGFMAGNQLLVLVEEQSSFNPNMAMRYLLYVANTYQNYIFEQKMNIYETKKLEFPEPKFYLVYTGSRQFEGKQLRLSDSFAGGEESKLELIVDILTEEAVRGSILEEYMKFCKIYDGNNQAIADKWEALKQTITYCIENNILKEFLQNREREVREMLMQLYNQEQIWDLVMEEKYQLGLDEGREEGREEGMEKGIESATQSIAQKMKSMGFAADDIQKVTGLRL